MGLVDDYTHDDVTITPKGTLGGDGAYDYDGTAVTTKARVQVKTGVRKTTDGKEWMYKIKVYLRSGETIAMQDQITFSSSTYKVVDLAEQDGLDGKLDHYVAYCG